MNTETEQHAAFKAAIAKRGLQLRLYLQDTLYLTYDPSLDTQRRGFVKLPDLEQFAIDALKAFPRDEMFPGMWNLKVEMI